MARADAIEADFVRGELPPDSTTFTSPVFLGPDGDVSSDGLGNVSAGEIAFLKFDIPDIANVASISTFDFFVTLYDDDDGGGESGDIDFALPGNNVQFLETFTSLNHTTEADPETIEIDLTADQIAEIFPSLSDGTFRIRISRDTGDFYVAPTGSAIIDGDLLTDTPEPSSAYLMAGFCAAAGLLYLFRRFNRRTSIAQI
ncbi:MAG TPA: hypothetical protein VHY84_07575 [Bryobacteraceae bacterium]|jgi:hypothetical protein|nr:hypothetical protein [Bryobacteraceae bacterium]